MFNNTVITLTAESLSAVEGRVNAYCEKNDINPISISVVNSDPVYIYLIIDNLDIIKTT